MEGEEAWDTNTRRGSMGSQEKLTVFTLITSPLIANYIRARWWSCLILVYKEQSRIYMNISSDLVGSL